MCKIILFASFICLFVLQTSCHKTFYDPISIVSERHQYLKSIIINKLNIDSGDTDIYYFSNAYEKNDYIMKYLRETKSYGALNRYFMIASKENIIGGPQLTINKQKVCEISVSLPVYDISQDQICVMVEILSFSESNWIGSNSFYFLFDRLGSKDKLKYVSHVNTGIQTNVGPPTYLPDLKDIDTSSLKNKIIRIDSLLKNTQNKIPDSLKIKMGIKSRF
jgi:hypothetical protein